MSRGIPGRANRFLKLVLPVDYEKILITSVVTLASMAVFAGIFIGAGWVDVAADVPHNPMLLKVLETAREQAINRETRGIALPDNLSDPERVRRGAGNYQAMCANCHLVPGQESSEIRRGLYPLPPNLSQAGPGADLIRQSRNRFWVIKHGIKASGMPAWSKGGMNDQNIWDLVAFINYLPSLDAEGYRHLVHVSNGHVHGACDHFHDEKLSTDHHHERVQVTH